MGENIPGKRCRTSYQIGVQFKKPIGNCTKFINNLLHDKMLLVLPLPKNLIHGYSIPDIEKYHFYVCPDTGNASNFIGEIIRKDLVESLVFDEIRRYC